MLSYCYVPFRRHFEFRNCNVPDNGSRPTAPPPVNFQNLHTYLGRTYIFRGGGQSEMKASRQTLSI